ncbi:MAG: RluA family pseudouridine synthase [Sphingomicrobium sp.]
MAEAYDKTFTVAEDDDGIRLDRWFKRHMPDVSFNIVSRWARTGQVRLDDKKAAPGDRIATGQRLRFPDPDGLPDRSEKPQRVREPLTDEEASYVRDMVIYQDRNAFVLSKPPGLATQGGTKTHQHLDRLLDGLVDDDEARPKLVHRLDKDTSGALLVARTSRAAAQFAKAFSSRTARKVYWAIVVGVPAGQEGLIDLPLAKQPGTGGEKMHVSKEAGLAARTRWRLIDRAGNRAAWLELQPLTGRTHQLRVHMAALGHPIVGDAKYGGPEAFLTGGVSRKMHLHARRIRVDAPGGDTIDVTANLPDHFAESLEMLGFDAMDGDRLPLDKPSKDADPAAKAKRASAAAKARRQDRKGERRSRGAQPKPRKK